MQKYSTYQFRLSFFSYDVAAKIEKNWLPILIHKFCRNALGFLLGTKIIVADTLQDFFSFSQSVSELKILSAKVENLDRLVSMNKTIGHDLEVSQKALKL